MANSTSPHAADKPGPRLAVINYTGDRDNWGCRATSQELLAMIRRVYVERGDPQFSTIPLLSKTRADSPVKRLLGKILERGMLSGCAGYLHRKALAAAAWSLYGKYLPKLKQADCIVFQAEGTMTGQGFYGGLRLLLLPYYAKVILNKPVLAWNQTLYSAGGIFDRVLVGVARRFDFLAVREPASLEHAHGLGLSDCALIPDAAFNTVAAPDNPLPAQSQLRDGNYYCVSGSAVIHSVQQDAYLDLIRRLSLNTRLHVAVIGSAPEDRQFFQHLQSRLPPETSAALVPLESTYQQVAAVLRDAKFLISGRFHMGVLAATVGTPLVMLPSNTFKNEGLLALLRYPLPVREFEAWEEIERDVSYVVQNRAVLSSQILAAMERIKTLGARGEAMLRTAVEATSEPALRGDLRARIVASQSWWQSVGYAEQPKIIDDCVRSRYVRYLSLNSRRERRRLGLGQVNGVPVKGAAA